MEEHQATEANLKEIRLSEAGLSEAKAKQAKVAEAKLMSMSIAMFMAVVAMLGAVTAYRAALAEQDTLRRERRLQQGEMLELMKRQELLSKLSSRTRYENSAALHSSTADSDREEAAEACGHRPAARSAEKAGGGRRSCPRSLASALPQILLCRRCLSCVRAIDRNADRALGAGPGL